MALNAASFTLMIAEAMMGPTILGNILFLGLAILLAFSGGVVGAVVLFEQREKRAAVLPLISVLLIAYVVLRFYLDTVPAGYGP